MKFHATPEVHVRRNFGNGPSVSFALVLQVRLGSICRHFWRTYGFGQLSTREISFGVSLKTRQARLLPKYLTLPVSYWPSAKLMAVACIVNLIVVGWRAD